MSDTWHHKGQPWHHCGEDLWSRRPCGGMIYNSYTKWLTRRKERAAERRDIYREWRESEAAYE